jgi:hypothetical protein
MVAAMPTDAAVRMKEVVAAVAPALKEAGFRKRRHGFNRTTGDEVTHVVHFQMGPFDPPGTVEIPGLRENLHGRFTINLGVFAPAMHVDVGDPPEGWVNEYDCQMRKRIGDLLPERADVWWLLGHPEAPDVARQVVVEHGLPWLDRFPTTDAILAAYEHAGPYELGFPPREPLHIAAILLSKGERTPAADIVRAYLARKHAPGHRPWIEDFARRVGLTNL